MRSDFARLVIPVFFISLVSGCAGLERSSWLLLKQDVSAIGDESTERLPERRPKTTLETSLSDGDDLTFGTFRVSSAAMLPIAPPEKMFLVRPFVAAHTLN